MKSFFRTVLATMLGLLLFQILGFLIVVVIIAGVAASGSGAALLGGAALDPVALFLGAPIAAILGAQVGHIFGATYGRKLFDRPNGRFFTQERVAQTERWLTKYGIGKALILARFIPFVRIFNAGKCGKKSFAKKKHKKM